MKHLKIFILLCFLTFTVSCGQQKRYIQYKVKVGETMSQIAQKLDMKTKDLIRLNPDVVAEPKANSFIVVPEKKLESFKNKLINGNEVVSDSTKVVPELTEREKFIALLKESYVIYEVQPGDTFYSFKKKFNKSREELMLLNPELIEGLKVGQILKIKELEIEPLFEEVYYDDFIDTNNNIKAALLLPFRTDKYRSDTLTLKEIFAKNSTLVNIATDFYMGAEIAVDSLRSQGVNIDLSVYDTGSRRGNAIQQIITQENLNYNDVVIGPLYSEEAQMVASNVNIPVVFPVYSKNQAEFNSANIVKTSPDKTVFRLELERYVKNNFEEGNIIIISDGKLESRQNSNALLSTFNFEANASAIDIITPEEGFIEKERLLEFLKPDTNNWVIMATDENILVSDVINSLISLPEDTTAKLLTYDKAKVYDRIDNQKLAKLGFTYVSDEFVDDNSYGTRVFTKMYRNKNKTLPSFYATKGFDITYDILVRMASGKDLKSTFKEGLSSRVETKFDYRESEYISENRALFVVQYNEDLTLTKLN